MSDWRDERTLTHADLHHRNTVNIAKVACYRGWLRTFTRDMLPTSFLEKCKLIKDDEVWHVHLDYGADSVTVKDTDLELRSTGVVSEKWAGRLVEILMEIYPDWLEWSGYDGTEPPSWCPNSVHKEWDANYSKLNDPEFVNDGPHFRCLGCGWLVDTDGKRVREQVTPNENNGKNPGNTKAWPTSSTYVKKS